MALEQELQTYRDSLVDLVPHVGQFVVIKGSDIVGYYDTYNDALKVGVSNFKLEPFLVKQIAPVEQVLSFTRDYEFVCQP